MEWQNCKLIAIDLTGHQALLIENKNGTVLSRFNYPTAATPTGLAVHASGAKACLATKQENNGSIFILNLNSAERYRLPVDLPDPTQFAIDPEFKQAYFVSHESILYALDMMTLELKALAQPSGATCVGICLTGQHIYTAWETEAEGIAAAFSAAGDFLYEYKISGIPTNLCVWQNKLLIPFTESKTYGEGLAILSENTVPIYLTFQAPSATRALHVYPCNVTIDSTRNIAYVTNEDSGSITMIDLTDNSICDHFTIGRSITNLHLLPDTRFAIATSNMFADLTLLDLINQKLLSITERTKELSSLLAVVP